MKTFRHQNQLEELTKTLNSYQLHHLPFCVFKTGALLTTIRKIGFIHITVTTVKLITWIATTNIYYAKAYSTTHTSITKTFRASFSIAS